MQRGLSKVMGEVKKDFSFLSMPHSHSDWGQTEVTQELYLQEGSGLHFRAQQAIKILWEGHTSEAEADKQPWSPEGGDWACGAPEQTDALKSLLSTACPLGYTPSV